MPKDTEDLFDNVKLPKEKDAEPPPQPATPMREAAPAQAPQRTGAPLSRLLWLVVPLLAVVAAVALWSVSWWLVIVALGALAVGLVITAAVRNWQRRRPGGQSRSGTVLSSSRPSGRFGLGRSGSGRTGRGLGSLGSKRGTGTGLGRGTGSGRTGRGLFKRGTGKSGRGRSGTTGTGAASVGRAGRARTGGSPVRGGRIGSLLSQGRRGARAAKTGTGRSAVGGTGASRRTGRGTRSGAAGGSGLLGGKWTTSRANPKTWAGERRRAAQAVRAATKTRRRGKSHATKDTAGGKQPQATTGAKRPFWKPWQTKTYTKGGEPISNTENTSNSKPAKKPDVKRPDVKAQKKNGDSKNASTTVPSGTTAKPKNTPTLDDYPFDFEDQGSPDWQGPKPAREFAFDDMGFPSPTTKPKAKPATNSTPRSTIMANRITDIAAQTDASSPQTFRATTQDAADNLRRSAGTKQEEAGALRAQAQTWIDNGENSTAERLLREAAALEQDAAQRIAAAAAYEDVAASVQ